MNSSSHQQPEAEPKWQGISSLILGIISLLPVVLAYSIVLPSWSFVIPISIKTAIIAIMKFLQLLGIWLLPAAGFVLGIMGLKYTKKKLAIAGIVLSVIAFVLYTSVFYMTHRVEPC